MQEFRKNFKLVYSRYARQQYNRLNPNAIKGKFELSDEADKYIQRDVLYKALNNIIYGHIEPELKKIDDIRLSVWINYYGMDAAESTIPLKFGPQGKGGIRRRLTASCNHICCDWGYTIWNIRLLEKAGEKYEIVLVQQLAGCIARNMQLVHECPDFSVKISLDIATQCNDENMRNCLIEGFYEQLPIERNQKEYINPHGVVFYLPDFRISV